MEDCAHSDILRGHRSAPGCQVGAVGVGEEEEPEGVVGLWALPWSSCVGSLDPLCHAAPSGTPGRLCRYVRYGVHSCCTYAAPCKTPPPVQSWKWKPKSRSYT